MCEDVARADNPSRVGFVIIALASLAYALGTVLPTIAAAQQHATTPNFTMDNASAWLMVSCCRPRAGPARLPSTDTIPMSTTPAPTLTSSM
jgi:hypothetical protein